MGKKEKRFQGVPEGEKEAFKEMEGGNHYLSLQRNGGRGGVSILGDRIDRLERDVGKSNASRSS